MLEYLLNGFQDEMEKIAVESNEYEKKQGSYRLRGYVDNNWKSAKDFDKDYNRREKAGENPEVNVNGKNIKYDPKTIKELWKSQRVGLNYNKRLSGKDAESAKSSMSESYKKKHPFISKLYNPHG